MTKPRKKPTPPPPTEGSAKPKAGKVEPPKATPPQDVGIPAAQIEGCRKWFEHTAKLLEKGGRAKDAIVAAFAFWVGYPHLLELIGRNVKIVGPMPARLAMGPPKASGAAYHALNAAHYRATHFLMAEAEKCGLDPHPLFECGQIVQELYAGEPWKYYAGLHDTWPECMGTGRYSLPAGQQEALRTGEAVFVRLAVKLGIAENEDMADVARKVKLSLPPSAEVRSNPMTLAQLCRRYMNKENVRADKIKPILEQYDLHREHPNKNLWTVRLDGLEKATRERLTRKS